MKICEVNVIGDEVWANGWRVAILTKDAPPSIAGAFRDAVIELADDEECDEEFCPRAA